ncbi:3-oxo-tetronate kinase [Neorhizobium galegae]|uniref:3-oxo-tetronate kinase n=1 Tax=Neorhizobium galegae bv. officinalis TaxID=323656 RepID=A0A0T7GKI8_NEOGA|nr:3-oxo-tetronate kinase [Neorhizobium galegae]CDZ47791.1 Type III effector Hrp-dependent outers [Neorhizobium galegae bv. officinalis]
MKPVFGVVADDLTGGMETAAMLIAHGVDCAFVTDADAVKALGPVDAVVVAQKTRVIPVGEAVARNEHAARALLARGTRQIFFKYCATFDSTDQGNIGPVADMLMKLTGAPYTAFCPASPELKRTVYNGHLFLGSQLISDSSKRHDPLTPMTDPDLVRVLQRQTQTTVGLLPHPMIRAGGSVLEEALREQARRGARFFITDTIYNGDLDHIAALTLDWPLMTGNATIVQHYPALWRAKGLLAGVPHRRSLSAVVGKGVVLSGSCAERTLEQLADFERSHPVLRLDLTAIESPEQAVEAALAWALPKLDASPVGISTSAAPAAVSAAQLRYGRDGAAALAERILGDLAVAFRNEGVRRFVVAGGETSGSVVERLKVRNLRVGAYGGPGIGNAMTEEADPVAFCLKSGKLGPVDLFTRALNSMQNPEVAA